ncbi:MAG: hypothetical protein P4L54_02715 [Acidocella sp.]|nr:hypothetical protein [Acidocella sp.]
MRFILMAFGLIMLSASMARADTTLPPRKAGFWVTTMVMHMQMAGQAPDNDSTPMITAMCTDPATDLKTMNMRMGAMGKCDPLQVEGGDGSYTVTSKCADPMGGGVPILTHTTMTYVGDNTMHMESHTSSAHITGDMTGDSKWQGACPAGLVPGDVGRMVNGVFKKLTNVNDMPKTP